MFKCAKLSQDLSSQNLVLSVVLDSKYNAHSFLQPKKRSNFDDAGLLSTAWTRIFCHKSKRLTLFQADAQNKALEGEHTPH